MCPALIIFDLFHRFSPTGEDPSWLEHRWTDLDHLGHLPMLGHRLLRGVGADPQPQSQGEQTERPQRLGGFWGR